MRQFRSTVFIRSRSLVTLALVLGGVIPRCLPGQGSIESWGNDPYGQVSNTPTGTGFTQVAAGGFHSLALRSDGSIVSWGHDSYGQVSNTPSGSGFTQVAASSSHSLALRTDGSIASWGWDNWSQVSNTPGGPGFVQISAHGLHAIALYSYSIGNAYCFGDGTGASCPCSAFGNTGAGCANSGGVGGATLTATGNAYLGQDFQLNITGSPGNQPGLILRGALQLTGTPAGAGLLCTTGQTARSQIQVTSGGNTTFTDFQGAPFGESSYGAGVPTNYQFWYRDLQNTCPGSGFNFSNAWTVTWLP